MSEALHIGIAGCGVAGLTSALLLARAGHRVTLFDKMSTPAPVGSGLMIQPTGLSVLADLGLAEALCGYGQVIQRFRGLQAETGRLVLEVDYAAGGSLRRGLAVHRAALFEVLFKAVKAAGIPIETEIEIMGEGPSYFHDSAGRHHGPFDLRIDALGVWSPLCPKPATMLPYGALWATLDFPQDGAFERTRLAQRYLDASVMIGVLPVGRLPGDPKDKVTFFWSLPADGYASWRAAGLEIWKDHASTLWPECRVLLDQITDPEQLTMARYQHRTLGRPYTGSLVHLGDSYHAASPQLGQGANMALLDAYAFATAVEEGNSLSEALARYHALRRRHVALYQAMSWAFTPAYQSDSRILPWLRDHLTSPAANLPAAGGFIAALVAGFLYNPLESLGLPETDLPLGRD